MKFMRNIRTEFSELVRNNTNFSQREASGMLVLSFMLFLPILTIIYERVKRVEELNKETIRLQAKKADSLLAILEMQQPLSRETKLSMLELRPFNPNKLSKAEWQAMGIKPWIAEKVVNAINKKYIFLQKNDLEKFRGFPKEEYERLKNFIDLPDSVDRKKYYADLHDFKKPKYENSNYKNYKEHNSDKKDNYTSNYVREEYLKYTPKVIEKFDINTADTATLKQIRGIGEKTAIQIEKFREGIGGFHSLEQLKEVYILSSEAFSELQKYAFISSSFKIKKISINIAEYETLKNHSYIKGKAASILLKYKKQHGNYKTVEDIRKSGAIEEENLVKLIPYLEF